MYSDWLSISILPIDGTQINTTTPGESGLRISMKGYSTILKLKNWSFTIRWFSIISWTLIRAEVTSLQRHGWCILQPQLTGLHSYQNLYVHIMQQKKKKKKGDRIFIYRYMWTIYLHTILKFYTVFISKDKNLHDFNKG